MVHAFNNSKHLAIWHVVIAFSCRTLAGIEGNGMPGGAIPLAEDSGDPEAGSVGMDTDGKIGIEVFENGSGGESEFECFEAGLTDGRPVKALAFSEKRGDRGSDTGVSFNKAVIEICKAEEYLNFFNVRGGRPLINSNDTIRIHGNTFG